MSHEHTHTAFETPVDGKVESRFILALALTGLILVAEIIGGLWTGSLALLSDAAHVFMDMFALALAFGAIRLAALPPSHSHTYGFHRMKVIGPEGAPGLHEWQ